MGLRSDETRVPKKMAVGSYPIFTPLSGLNPPGDPSFEAGPGIEIPFVLFEAEDAVDPTQPGDGLTISVEVPFLGSIDLGTASYEGVPQQSQGTADNIILSVDATGLLGLLAAAIVVVENSGAPQFVIDLVTGFLADAISIVNDNTSPSGDFFFALGNDDLSDGDLVAEDTILCLTAGTQILTPTGTTAIENLQVGDVIQTSEGPKPVKFIGITSTNTLSLARAGKLPVHIAKGSLGNSLPSDDITCTPSHAFAIKGCLVEAQALVNGSTIHHLDSSELEQITFYSIELDSHHLITANGALTESFIELNRPTNASRSIRASWDNWNEYIALYGCADPMEELVMPRVPFARQLTSEMRTLMGLKTREESFELVTNS